MFATCLLLAGCKKEDSEDKCRPNHKFTFLYPDGTPAANVMTFSTDCSSSFAEAGVTSSRGEKFVSANICPGKFGQPAPVLIGVEIDSSYYGIGAYSNGDQVITLSPRINYQVRYIDTVPNRYLVTAGMNIDPFCGGDVGEIRRLYEVENSDTLWSPFDTTFQVQSFPKTTVQFMAVKAMDGTSASNSNHIVGESNVTFSLSPE